MAELGFKVRAILAFPHHDPLLTDQVPRTVLGDPGEGGEEALTGRKVAGHQTTLSTQ